jgi:predicted DsbA family dithiol-disulfide isomerase
MPVIQVFYYTDPACPWSWALEPSLRKLLCVFGQSLRFTYVMCGMAREFSNPQALVGELLEAGARSGMPVDPRLWLEGPPGSSFPACIAVKAAAEQGDPAAYLRRVREGVQCRRRKLDVAEALVEEARAVPGLDVERFRIDLSSHASLESFGADLERATAVAPEHYAAGSERVQLPSLEFRAADGAIHGVYGYAAYEDLERAALAAGAEPSGALPPSIEAALRRFGSMATAEIAAVCALPGPRAPAELWRLASEWRLQAERVGSGELWSAA